MSIAIVNGDKVLGEGDDGTLQRIGSESVITIPHSSKYKFQIQDRIPIFKETSDDVTFVAEPGVAFCAKGNKIGPQFGKAELEMVAEDDWIASGDLTNN